MAMEMITCPNHPDSFCLLKTGTKPGPSHGVSFYICTQCKFVKQSTQSQSSCSLHNKTIELQSFVVRKDGKGTRQYYRCDGRDDGKSWCGYKQISEAKVDSLAISSSRKTEEMGKKGSDVKELKDKNVANTGASNEDAVKRVTEPLKEKKENVGANLNQCKIDKIDQEKKHIPKQPLTFSDLSSRTKTSPTSSQGSTTPFQNKSFHHYRDSPDPLNRLGTNPIHRQRKDSDSSDSGCDNDIVDETQDLMEGLAIKDDSGVKTKTVVDSDMSKLSVVDSERAVLKPAKAETETKTLQTVNSSDSGKEECGANAASTLQHQTTARTGRVVEKNVDIDHVKARVLFRNLREERRITVAEQDKLQNSLRAIRLTSLPDKGQKLLSRVSSYKEHIVSLDRRMIALLQKHGNSITKESDVGHSMHRQSQVVRVYPGTGNAVNTVVVKPHQVAVPGSSHTTQSSSSDGTSGGTKFIELPSHMSQYFAANPQAMTLYGGRMTAQRLRDVGSITTEAIDKIHKQLESCPTESTEVTDPPGLQVPLMSHQRQALAWLEWREQQHPAGGILADDMGLGKTLTMISHIMRKKQEVGEESASAKEGWLAKGKQARKSIKKSRGTLIVAPASLVHQWAKEIEKRCASNRLKFLVYHGPNRESNINKLSDNDIVITTYAIVSREVGADECDAEKAVKDDDGDDEEEKKGDDEKDNGKTEKASLPLLLRIGWERIILDEAHDIKNHKSARAQSVCRLRAAYRWALTGTPIQNDLKDMYSLLRFLRFSPFDELKVWKRHIESAKVSTKRLNTLVKALLLRRTKDQTTLSGKPLVELPNRTYENVNVELGEEEQKIYDKLFQKTQSTVKAYVHRHQDSNPSTNPSQPPSAGNPMSHHSGGAVGGGSGDMGDMNKPKNTGSQILVFLLRLRQCCSHLSLLKSHLEAESLETDGIELSLQEQMKGLALDGGEGEGGEVAPSGLTKSALFEVSTLSTKLSHVMTKVLTLKEEKPTDKSVIVSQWTAMLDIVAHHLKKSKITYSLIQGNVPAKKRADIVEDFNRTGAGAKVLLVSLCAGGVGLNLIGGNHLFLLDSHWNPALEAQACDRIYRIGQTKDVRIYRFICKKTIEEKIWVLQQGKLSLAKSVLSGTANKNQKLSLDDLRMLFGV